MSNRDLLNGVKGTEINWPAVSAVFADFRHPVKRRRSLQIALPPDAAPRLLGVVIEDELGALPPPVVREEIRLLAAAGIGYAVRRA